MVIQDAEETVERVEVHQNSPIAGKSLKEARIPEETGMWVLVIRRGGKWVKPRPSLVIMEGDMIIASGYSEGEDDFKELIRGLN
jgi:uncharacterized protein with PhoU and TrkA domain